MFELNFAEAGYCGLPMTNRSTDRQTMSQTPPSKPNPTVHLSAPAVVARHLARHAPTVNASVKGNQVLSIFHDDPLLTAIAVVDEQAKIIGVLRSHEILRRGTEFFFHELDGRRTCTRVMDAHPLIFDADTSLVDMSKAVTELDDRLLADGFFVTENGNYLGAGRMTDLIKAVTEQQVSAARHANPLTLLPGNFPIDQHIQQLLSSRKAFVACYFDLDNFKPFNDVYGYVAGDEVIRLTGRVLNQEMHPSLDFLGHIGGDDFIALFCAADWEPRVQRVLAHFDAKVKAHFREEHLASGGLVTNNRQGMEVFHGLVALSAGIVKVAPGDFEWPSEVSERLVDAKKQAKLTPGSTYFVDRRAVNPLP